MVIEFTPELREYMRGGRRHGIIVEVASCDNTDLEVTELHIHFVTQQQAEGFVKRKKFRKLETDCCPVYLPNYRLEYDERIVFSLRKLGPFRTVRCEGIAL